MPGYFASNALASRSASGRSTDVYQTTLPSRRAASTRAGVTWVGSGAARNGDTMLPSAKPVDAFSTSRRESLARRMPVPLDPAPRSSADSPDPDTQSVGRQTKPDGGARRDVLLGRRDHADLRAADDLHHIIAAAAEKDFGQAELLDFSGVHRHNASLLKRPLPSLPRRGGMEAPEPKPRSRLLSCRPRRSRSDRTARSARRRSVASAIA